MTRPDALTTFLLAVAGLAAAFGAWALYLHAFAVACWLGLTACLFALGARWTAR